MVAYLLVSIMLAWTLPVAANSDLWEYIASYQGLFSLGVPLDIAKVTVILPSLSNQGTEAVAGVINLTTADFAKVEMLLPTRFCYRTKFTLQSCATDSAAWWSAIGKEVSIGQVDFNHSSRQVLFRHVARKLTNWQPPEALLTRQVSKSTWATTADPDRHVLQFADTSGSLMDRLSMLQWLRKQDITLAQKFDLIVSDGNKLLGFKVVVEAKEQLWWQGHEVESWRMLLQPQVRANEDASPTWMWLSADARRLPLLFRSSRAFGAVEVRLQGWSSTTKSWSVADTLAIPVACQVPTAVRELQLPSN